MKKRNKIKTCLIIIFAVASSVCSDASEKWQRDKTPLITNFNNMYQPCVVETGEDYKYKMWFFGWAAGMINPDVPGADAIFHARSRDLKEWEIYSKGGKWDKTMNPKKWKPVLYAGTNWYETWHTGDPSVVLKKGKFYMAYSSTSKTFDKQVVGYPVSMACCVMGAESSDGIHWKKTKQPLLIRDKDRMNPKPDPERIGDFHRPCLRWENGKWKLWFDYWLPGKGICMGYSENRENFAKKNGFKISHDLKLPVMENWPNPEIIKIGDQYHAFADPIGYPIKKGQSPWMHRQLREAVSKDGINWKKLDFIPPDDDAPACHVAQALVTGINGTNWLYLFYATQIGNNKKDGTYHYQYDKIRAMKRKIK